MNPAQKILDSIGMISLEGKQKILDLCEKKINNSQISINKCIVCGDDKRKILVYPCKHLNCSVECLQNNKCTFCGNYVEKTYNVYYC